MTTADGNQGMQRGVRDSEQYLRNTAQHIIRKYARRDAMLRHLKEQGCAIDEHARNQNREQMTDDLVTALMRLMFPELDKPINHIFRHAVADMLKLLDVGIDPLEFLAEKMKAN